MRVFVGGLIVGVILYIVPGTRSGPACLIAGWIASFLTAQAGARSVVERMGLLLGIALVAWAAGPRAAVKESLLWHLAGWTAASAALAFYLRPRSE